MPKNDGNDLGVGYGKPPKQTQFKKGKSGNPKGRRKGSKNPATVVRELNDEPIPVTKNGKTRYMSSLRVLLTQTRNDALRGEPKAVREWRMWLLSYPEVAGIPTIPQVLHERDEIVMAGIMDRMRDALLNENSETTTDQTGIESEESAPDDVD